MTPEETAVVVAALKYVDSPFADNADELSEAVQALIYSCPDCNHDTHRCPGCGLHIWHGQKDCGRGCTDAPLPPTRFAGPCPECGCQGGHRATCRYSGRIAPPPDDKQLKREAEREPIWVECTWRDVRTGDLVRLPHNPSVSPSRVASAVLQGWHVDPRSSEYRPAPLEHSTVRVTLADPASGSFLGSYLMDPDKPIEIQAHLSDLHAARTLGVDFWESRPR